MANCGNAGKSNHFGFEMTSKIIPCQNVWGLFYIPPYWTPWIKNENPDFICGQILHSSFSQVLFKVWLLDAPLTKIKICDSAFLTVNTKSFIKIDLLCPVAEAQWTWRPRPSFQPSSCSKKGTRLSVSILRISSSKLRLFCPPVCFGFVHSS